MIDKIHILITDDDKLNRKVFKRLFPTVCKKDFNFNGEIIIDEAENGEIALNMMKNNKYDLVFMDIHMPVMEGDVAVREFREFEKIRDYKSKIIALSASTGSTEKYQDIMDDYIPKPVNKEKIYEAIKTFIC